MFMTAIQSMFPAMQQQMQQGNLQDRSRIQLLSQPRRLPTLAIGDSSQQSQQPLPLALANHWPPSLAGGMTHQQQLQFEESQNSLESPLTLRLQQSPPASPPAATAVVPAVHRLEPVTPTAAQVVPAPRAVAPIVAASTHGNRRDPVEMLAMLEERRHDKKVAPAAPAAAKAKGKAKGKGKKAKGKAKVKGKAKAAAGAKAAKGEATAAKETVTAAADEVATAAKDKAKAVADAKAKGKAAAVKKTTKVATDAKAKKMTGKPAKGEAKAIVAVGSPGDVAAGLAAGGAVAFILGCGKCRGSHVGCAQCRDWKFTGRRWQR